MSENYVQISTITTARPTIARAVVGSVAVLAMLILGVQWSRTSAPEQSSMVASGTQLSSDIVAIVRFYDSSRNNDFLNRVKAHLLLDKTTSVVALLDDGSIEEVPEGDIDRFATSLSRPHMWYMPNTLGVVHFRDSSGQVRTLRLSGNKKKLNVHHSNKDDVISSLIPNNAMYGARLSCENECDEVEVNDIAINIPASFDGSDFFSQYIDGSTESTFVFNDKNTPSGDVEDFAREVLSRAQPKVEERLLSDGVTVRELVPDTDINVEHYGGVLKYGTEPYALYSIANISTETVTRYLSSSDASIVDNSHLSTQSWTKRICGVRPSYFMALTFSATFAENPTAPLYLARSKNGWVVCEK